MYFTPQEATSYIKSLTSISLPPSIGLFIIPDFLSLSSASQSLFGPSSPLQQGIRLGAQDCFWEDSGPYTGEISPQHLQELSCSLVELGHAERRRWCGETNETVAKKVAAVLRNGMTPLVCIGEMLHATVASAISEMKPQVLSVLEVAKQYGSAAEIVFAYEPVWAIGQAEPASAEYVTEVTRKLRALYGGREGIAMIYGGSAGRGTFKGIKEGVDGMFLGRFAHDFESLRDIINEVAAYD